MSNPADTSALAFRLLAHGRRLVAGDTGAAVDFYRCGRQAEGPAPYDAGLLYVQAVRGYERHKGDLAAAVTWRAICGQIECLLEIDFRRAVQAEEMAG